MRWHADRAESLMTDYHGRDQDVEVQLGLDADGKITALQVVSKFNQEKYYYFFIQSQQHTIPYGAIHVVYHLISLTHTCQAVLIWILQALQVCCLTEKESILHEATKSLPV